MINAYTLFKNRVLLTRDVIDRILYTGVPAELAALDRAAESALRTGNWREAKRVLTQSIDLEPDWFLTHFRLGYLAQELGNDDVARTQYLTCLQLEPKWAPAFYNLGRIYRRAGLIEEAIGALQLSLGLDPDDPDAFLNLALCFSSLKDEETENKIYLHVLKNWPDVSTAHINFALNMKAKGENLLARQHLEAVLKQEPVSSPLYAKALLELRD